MDTLLAAYEAQLRSSGSPEDDGDVRRVVAADPRGWNAVVSSALTPETADGAIARQVRHFGGLGRSFEWKWYSHDEPADLPARLRAAGFTEGPEEALMIAPVAELGRDPVAPDGVVIRRCGDAADIAAVVSLHDQVFGEDHGELGTDLTARLAAGDGTVQVFVVEAAGVPVSAARLELHPGTDFASIWGGGTLPEWRHRGIYRALVAHRARIACEEGFRLLQVDASPESEPILRRLGFVRVATTRPYLSPT